MSVTSETLSSLSRVTLDGDDQTYRAHARSNYFEVRDPEAFRAFAEAHDLIVVAPGVSSDVDLTNRNAGAVFALIANRDDGWPELSHDEDGNLQEVSFTELLAPHLVNGETAVLMEVGILGTDHPSGLANIEGVAQFVCSNGYQGSVSLQEIFKKAMHTTLNRELSGLFR